MADCSPEELEAMKKLIYIHDEDVIYYEEIPEASPFSAEVLFDEAMRLSKTMSTKPAYSPF
jgi:hypothetical protein